MNSLIVGDRRPWLQAVIREEGNCIGPDGSLAKASSVWAKTIYGPVPLRVFTRPPALTATTRVPKKPVLFWSINNVSHVFAFAVSVGSVNKV